MKISPILSPILQSYQHPVIEVQFGFGTWVWRGSPLYFNHFDDLLEGVPMDAKSPLKVLRRSCLSYCRVHHQDACILLCPDVSSFLPQLARGAKSNLQEVYSFCLRWYSPYSEPPAGLDRFIIEDVKIPSDRRWSSHNIPGCINLIYDQMQREGLPYVIGVTAHSTRPRHTQSLAGKQSRRRSLLRGRLAKKYPLLAEQMYKDAIAAKPDYYGKP